MDLIVIWSFIRSFEDISSLVRRCDIIHNKTSQRADEST